MGMLKEPPRSVWPNLSAGAVEKSNVLGTVVTLGAPGTLRTWDIPARGMEVPRVASWVSEAETSSCAERCQQAPAIPGSLQGLQKPSQSFWGSRMPSHSLPFSRMLQQALIPGCGLHGVRPPFPPRCLCQAQRARAGWLRGSHVSGGAVRGAAPPGAPAGRVARGPLPAAGCLLRALWSCGWSRGLGQAGGPGQGTPVPGVALLARHQGAQFLPTAAGIRCCVGWRSCSWRWCPGVPPTPESECWRWRDGAPPKTHLPLCPHGLGTPYVSPAWASPALAFGRARVCLARGWGERGSPLSRAPHPRCQNPPLAAAASGRSGQGKDAWNSCPGAERDRSKY